MTINEIAALAGVSISTVSKIMNNKADNINPSTKERVLAIVKEYNYVPYASIKNSSRGKTFLIAVLLKNHLFTTRITEGITCYAQSQGYTLLISNSYDNQQTELKNITAICKHSVDGVIWEPVSEDSLRFRHYFDQAGIKSVYINSDTEDSYFIDFKKMGYHAAKELINQNHTRLACLIQQESQRSMAAIEGFQQCLYEHHLPFDDSRLFLAGDSTNFSKMIQQGITAIVSTHFASSLEFYGELSQKHYQIPYELSLLSLKDDSREPTNYPPISTINIPYFKFGEHVCKELIRRCEDDTVLFNQFFIPHLLDHTYSIDIPYTSRQPKVLVVGSINTDILLSVNQLPRTGETVSTTRCSTFAGGKGCNQAVGVARLGHHASLIGKVGNDIDAGIIYNCMRDNGVDAAGIIHDQRHATGKAYIHVQNDGESIISIYSGVNNLITSADIASMERLFEHTGFCLLQTEIAMEAVEAAAHMAKLHGAKTILKPSATHSLSDSLLSDIDILVPNQAELNILCPHINDISQQAACLLSKGVQTVIVTLGAKGCYMRCTESERYFDAADFISIDSTGASDAFISALTAYILYGYSIEKAIRIAAYAAGFCISRLGVTPALIDRNSLEAYINKKEPELL